MDVYRKALKSLNADIGAALVTLLIFAVLRKGEPMSNLIDRLAAIDHWRAIIDATDGDSRYDMGFIDGLEFCISHLSTMPSEQPFHNITMNDVLKYIDGMPEDVWQEFTACLECRGWELQRRTAKWCGSEFCMSDLIDRQKAIDEINKLEYPSSLVDVKRIIVDLPSAEPERKTGKWTQISPAGIYECSECAQMVMTKDIGCYKYCHGCGAYMGGNADEAN